MDTLTFEERWAIVEELVKIMPGTDKRELLKASDNLLLEWEEEYLEEAD